MSTKKLTTLKLLITDLPNSDLKYWFSELYNSLLLEKNNPVPEDFIDSAINLLKETKKYTTSKQNRNEINKLFNKLDEFIELSETNSISVKAKQCSLNIGGIILGTVLAVFGGILGFLRGAISCKNYILVGAIIGGITGAAIGSTIGYRLPKRILKNQDFRMRKMSTDQIVSAYSNNFKKNNPSTTMETLKKEIIKKYFDNNQSEFSKFLESETEYDIVGMPAEFLSSQLKGQVGQHALIHCKINNKEIFIESGAATSSKYFRNGKISQTEKRKVTGEKLLEMMLVHRNIQENGMKVAIKNIPHRASFYKVGDRDCHTYLDMILVGTNQNRHNLQRFSDTDKFEAKYILSPIFAFLSPRKSHNQEEYKEFSQNLHFAKNNATAV